MLVPGELIIKLTNDFPECAHCLLARGQGLARSTGRRTLDQIRLKHGIRHLQPLFDGEHGSERRRRAQQRFGRARTGSVHPDTVPALEHIYAIRVRAETDLTALAADLQRDPAVEWVEPNYIYRINRASDDQLVSALHLAGLDEEPGAEIPNDPFLHSSGSWGQSFADLWGLFQIGAPAAWEISQGDDVVVAVIDSGLDITHPDIAANVWVNEGEIAGNGIDDDGNGFVDDVYGWDFTRCEETYLFGGVCSQAKEPGPDVSDPIGHGTHMAGIIAAVPDNELGMIGVAPRARVMAVKGLDRSGSGHGEDLAEALVYAAENGARVINASWAGPPSRTIETAIQYITATFDVVVVASVGNDAVPLERGVYPANLASVIAVGATTETGERAPFSNFGGPLDLVAPGGGGRDPAGGVRPDRSILSLLGRDSREREGWSGVCRYECIRCECGPVRVGEEIECPANVCVEWEELCTEERGCGLVCVYCSEGPAFPPFSGVHCPCDEDSCAEEREVCEAAPWVIEEEYVRQSGTSMAAAFVSGVAALVRSARAEFTYRQVRQALVASATEIDPAGIGTEGWNQDYGYGRADAAAAVAITAIPVAQITVPVNRQKVWERNFPITVMGTALGGSRPLRSWELRLRDEAGSAAAGVVVARGSAAITDDVLGTLDSDEPLALTPGGRYVLKLVVEDQDGNQAVDTAVFLVPNPRYAIVPIPDRFDEGGQNVTMSEDGGRILIQRLPWNPPNSGPRSTIWLLDARSRTLRAVAKGILPNLDPTGAFLTYRGFPPGISSGMESNFFYSVDTSLIAKLPTNVVPRGPLSRGASRMAFSTHSDPLGSNPDRGVEVFLFDLPGGSLQQATISDHSNNRWGVSLDNLAISADGKRVLFTSNGVFDSDFAPTNGIIHAFLYDDAIGQTRRLTGRSGFPQFANASTTMDAHGRKVSIETDIGISLIHLDGDVSETLIDRFMIGDPFGGTQARISGDGTKLVFNSNRQLDPSVGDENLGGEVYVLDIESGEFTQVTDRDRSFSAAGIVAVDRTADTIVLHPSGVLNDLGVFPSLTRAILRQRATNSAPVLSVPTTIRIPEGQKTSIQLVATDTDGDSITFYAERVPAFLIGVHGSRLGQLANSELIDHGDGTGEWSFTPNYKDAGEYPLRLAAFDEEGGADIIDIALIIEDTQIQGDADCNGTIEAVDLDSLIRAIFDSSDFTNCPSSDVAGDGLVRANDITALVKLL